MKRLFRAIFHIDHVLVTLTTMGIIYVIVGVAFNISFLSPVARTIDNFSMTDIFYDIANSDGKMDTSDIVTLVDMTPEFDRGRLASLIEEIDSLEPAMLGIDIVFDGIREDREGNERLVEAVCSITSPTVWAYKMTDWSDEEGQFKDSFHSFFAEDVEGLNEGYANVQRDVNGGTVRSYSIKRMAEGNWSYSLPAKVSVGFLGDSALLGNKTDCTICYNSIHFPVVPYDSLENYADLIRGHIVLLGALDDQRDQHYTPIGRIAGLSVLAYAIQTMVKRQIPLEFSFWETMFFTLLFIWLGQLCQHGFSRYLVKRKNKVLCYIGESGMASSLMAFFLMGLLVGVCFWLFFRYNICLNTMWAIMGIALLDNARELYAFVIHLLSSKYNWHWVRRSLYKLNTPT